MVMELLELPGWRLEHDRSATVAAYACIESSSPETCRCNSCRNWVATRRRVLPREFRALLKRLGIPSDQEAEVYHMGRLASGLHSYGAWYHFIGRVLYGEREGSAHVALGGFEVYFHSRPALLPEAFAGQPVVQLEAVTEVPWLSDVPETE
jgi:hypothetical protein